jgi:hypothetical protein
MSRPYNFVEREVFEKLLREVPRVDGEDYEDINTIYGDMSRLAVVLFATTPPEQLQELYEKLGWKGNANVRAMHEVAKKWLEENHPGRF